MATSPRSDSQSRASRVWSSCFRLLFWLTPNRLVLSIVSRTSRLPVAHVEIAGRRSGIVRTQPLSILVADGRWYVGHPNGRSQWVQNLAAAGAATVVRDGHRWPVRAVELSDCPERDEAVRATAQQPFPANLVYRAARSHVAAVGTYFRLEPEQQSEGATL
jgi:deazaflavin-dependent oxidoreductase (nitroreductase family)